MMAVLTAWLLFTSACSWGSDETSSREPSTTAAYPPPVCEARPRSTVAVPVAGSAVDWDLTSFDGTRIRMHWMPLPGIAPGGRAPTILMGAGWGLPGASMTDLVDTNALAAVDIATLHSAGYNVLTWDARGFGASSGTARIDSPDVEGADVRALLDWVASRPEVQLDRPGDPRIGMVGASYAGAIGLIAAATDCRVDTVVAMYTWHSLAESLVPDGIPKSPWLKVLSDTAPGERADAHLHSASASAASEGRVSATDLSFFRDRGIGDEVAAVRVPMMFVQGTVDGLVDLDQAIASYRIVLDRKVPTKLVWTCGGHGICLTADADPSFVAGRVIPWLARYLRRDGAVDTGPAFEMRSDDGAVYEAASYPLESGRHLSGVASGRLPLRSEGGSGPIDPTRIAWVKGANDALRAAPAPASNAVDVPVGVPVEGGVIVGAPVLELRYRGTVQAGAKPTAVFAQLVDADHDLVVGGRVFPVLLELDGEVHSSTVSLGTLAHSFDAGANLRLQLVAATSALALPRLGGEVVFERVSVRLPVATNLVRTSR